MPLHKNVVSHQGSIHSNGWFATDDISEGEMIWWEGQADYDAKEKCVMCSEELDKLTEKERNDFWSLGYQVEQDLFESPVNSELDTEEFRREYYINHSCNGNCWYQLTYSFAVKIKGHDKLIAKRDIKKGEEIFYDYALTEAHKYMSFDCNCGSKNCRGKVTSQDYKIKELQQNYKGHFLGKL